MIVIGMILVSGWAIRHAGFLTDFFAASPFGDAEEDEVEEPLETIVLNTANPETLKKQVRDLVDRVAVERREKNDTAAKLSNSARNRPAQGKPGHGGGQVSDGFERGGPGKTGATDAASIARSRLSWLATRDATPSVARTAAGS